MKADKLKDLATKTLEDMKGKDIACLKIGKMSSFADYMLVVTGTSARHVKSLAVEVSKKVKETGSVTPRMEGEEQGEWILIDLGDVVVHVMQAEIRRTYDLESLWSVGNTKP